MHDAAELMKMMAEGIAADEAFAENLATLAARAHAGGWSDSADAFYSQARLHRVKAMELRARLGAMVERYGPLHLAQR